MTTADRWARYRASVESKDGMQGHIVHVYAMNEQTAREKLTAEYPKKFWEITGFEFLRYED